MNIQKNEAFKVIKSICKLYIKYNDDDGLTCIITGFFINISNSLKYLIKYCQFMQKELIKTIVVEIWNKKTMNLSINERRIISFQEPKDIIAIEIKESDYIYNDIQFLNYDSQSDSNKDNLSYITKNNFGMIYNNGKHIAYEKVKIVEIKEYEFIYQIMESNIFSGHPIISWNNNINEIKVIGIYTGRDFLKNINYASFIDKIIRDIIIMNKDSNNKLNIDKNKIFNHSSNNYNKNLNSKNSINISTNINELNINEFKNKKENNSINKEQKNLFNSGNLTNVITLFFISIDQSIHDSIICKTTDIFNTVANKLFKKYPEFKDRRLFFICNGSVIYEYKEIANNNLKNGDTILINLFD